MPDFSEVCAIIYAENLNERVNTWCQKIGKRHVCLISIHANAAGNGRQWMIARGWCCYTSRGQTAGDRLATSLYEAASLYLPGIIDLHVRGIISYVKG